MYGEKINTRWPDLGIIDCDIHNHMPLIEELSPYLSSDWRDYFIERQIPGFDPNFYPKNSPLSTRPGVTPFSGAATASQVEQIKEHLDLWNVRYSVLNCITVVQSLQNEYLAVELARAINDWQEAEWLQNDSRLKASIIIADQSPMDAVREIERLGDHPGFVQVLLLVRSRMPYGKRYFWPIYKAAEAHGLPICIHAGGSAGNPTTPVGWPSYYAEEYINNSAAFQEQVISMVSEGVFMKFPNLKVVLAEGGFTWMPPLMWRFDKNWKGLRRDVPWVDRYPSEIIKEHFKLTIQPLDEPENPKYLAEVIEHLGSEDMLLFSTDFPHWQYDQSIDSMPKGISESLEEKILQGNARSIYTKLGVHYAKPSS
ncbi:amidohydrolase family protein [Halalkalibacter okhensis]|uniref:Hydrolase n=1 Tax=Halalkalibacter okhensis TaxID=333138 RepID=A0A0B0ID52_9BACI|nr:amidohydrolase family protein [Halalkalibacter okhensis]KHF37969.1 hydrolase [Halalkalibacter okhensis]